MWTRRDKILHPQSETRATTTKGAADETRLRGCAVNQGHCHPRIVAALVAQAQKLTLSSRAFHNSVFGRFAERVGSVFGWEMVLPMNTGAEAAESALKLARKWAYLRKGVPEGEAIVLSVADNFHGRTLGVISMSTDPYARVGFGPYLPAWGRREISDLERALELHGPRVAAFLVEPVQGEAASGASVAAMQANNRPAPDLPPRRRRALQEAQHASDLRRDTDGVREDWEDARHRPRRHPPGHRAPRQGALGRGVPRVGGAGGQGRDAVHTARGAWEYVWGNPLACAVAITALDALVEEALSARAARLGEVFRSSVLALNSPYIKTVRGLGLLNAVVIDEDACNAARAAGRRGEQAEDGVAVLPPVEGEGRVGEDDAWECVSVSILLGATATEPARLFSSLLPFARSCMVRFAPPLVIEGADLVKAVKIIGECLVDIERLDGIPEDDSEESGH
ncbi:ornithine-oxo-acid aminotransferase [Mycena olivaceomarginata]|nr:ornithine-oxo-acid aminotransferase [Mycena olivaceomarginata]